MTATKTAGEARTRELVRIWLAAHLKTAPADTCSSFTQPAFDRIDASDLVGGPEATEYVDPGLFEEIAGEECDAALDAWMRSMRACDGPAGGGS